MHRKVLHNRQVKSVEEVRLSPGQVGLLNGWGVFSTLRISQSVPFAFERHYRRMLGDAELLRVPFPFSAGDLYERLGWLIEANEVSDAVLRVAVVRNRGGLFEGPSEWPCDLIAFTSDLQDWGSGARLSYVPNARFGASPFAGVKITSWAQNLTWYEQAHENGFDEVLLLNEHGAVSECTSANIFAIQGKEVFTPPLATSGCLPGVTRALLLEEIHSKGVSIKERELSPLALETSDCVFMTSTTRDLLPVVSIDEFPMQQNHRVFDQLRGEFARYLARYTDQAASRKHLVHS